MDYTEFSKLRNILLERAKIFISKESRANCKYMVNAENRVDVLGSVFIKKEDLIDGMLPLPFGEILGRFDCSGLGLTTLKGSPTRVKYFFDCSNNKLSNLDYCPKYIDGDFYCDGNLLESLEGCPKEVGGHFGCNPNLAHFTKKDIRHNCLVLDREFVIPEFMGKYI